VGVILINLSDKKYEIKPGDRIAQMIISKFSNVNWKLVEDIGHSKRGKSGFGSTGENEII
jgi:dUTP pyrophosphatase